MQLTNSPDPKRPRTLNDEHARRGQRQAPPVFRRSSQPTSANLDGKMHDFFDAQKQTPIIEMSGDRSQLMLFIRELADLIKEQATKLYMKYRPILSRSLRSGFGFARHELKHGLAYIATLPTAKKRVLLASAGISAAIIITVLASSLLLNKSGDIAANPTSSDGSVQGAQSQEVVEPEFDVVAVPGGTEQVKYDPSKKTASTPVMITGVSAVLSQQLIEGEAASNELLLLQAAQSYGLNKELQTRKGGVFIGENREDRVTIAAFRYENFLFFIRTTNLVDQQAVLDFINNLQ